MRFIGDIHACFDEYLDIIEGADHSIQVGDFGAGFAGIPSFSSNHKFIRGNHDNPEICRGNPNWISDGATLFIEGVEILCIGGAMSSDRLIRTEGCDWWQDEELSYSNLARLVEHAIETKPAVIVTHDCPLEVADEYFKIYRSMTSRTAQALSALFDQYQPKLWVFGHHHHTLDTTHFGTRFVCVNQNDFIDISLGDLLGVTE